MSLFRDSMRPPPLASDAAVRRYVELIRAELEPDPLFLRRLRGTVVNRFVAAREGLEQPAWQASAMGKLGRACLYATFALGVSVGGAMAASQAALPGDALYPLKRNIEALRLQALPAHLHDELAVMALSERINELGRLAEAGDWERAAGLAASIGDGYEQLADLGMTDAQNGQLQSRLAVMESLFADLPPQAQAAIERAMDHAPGLNGQGPPGQVDNPGRNGLRSGTNNVNNGNTNAPPRFVEDLEQAGEGADRSPKPKPSHSPPGQSPDAEAETSD